MSLESGTNSAPRCIEVPDLTNAVEGGSISQFLGFLDVLEGQACLELVHTEATRAECELMSAKPRPKASAAHARPSKLQSRSSEPVFDNFLKVVRSLGKVTAPQSENELSRRFADVLEERGLFTVVDTSPRGTRKRPDILVYTNQLERELLIHADAAIESKRPGELRPGTTILDAILDQYWDDKTFPYVTKNLSRIQYFILTTFRDYAVLRIDDELRLRFAKALKGKKADHESLKNAARKQVQVFSLGGATEAERNAAERKWSYWFDSHLNNKQLHPVPLSTVSNLHCVETHAELEGFAARLAGIASDTLFLSLRERVAPNYELTSENLKRDLFLFVMSQNASADPAIADGILQKSKKRWVDDFIAASIHSLISRLFALKVIEDAYCIEQKQPLIESRLWVVNTTDHNGLSPEDLLVSVTKRMQKLSASKNTIVRGIAVFGAFFDWITEQIDPVVFRTLFELFVTHDFKNLQGDLLGRFFEVYSQKINNTSRRELGQYYTPLPIVRFMWSLVEGELRARDLHAQVTVLDPGMGSATFLREGARRLAEDQVPKFWERLTGFDISPQVLGIAQLNLYMAVLSQMQRSRASEVVDLRVYTTDALDPRNGRHLKAIAPLFPQTAQQEFLRRSQVSAATKQDERFWVVIGNPPYKNNAAMTLAQMADRFPNLLASSAKVGKSQQSYIRDDYAWFFAAADEYVQGRGMICFLTSDSFLFKESYALFRREVVRRYELRKIVRLGSGLFRDVGPNIGFVITILVRRSAPLSDEVLDSGPVEPPIELHDLRTLVQSSLPSDRDNDPRLRFLESVVSGHHELEAPALFKASASHAFVLVPSDAPVISQIGRSGEPITKIFSRKWPGIKTAFDSLLKDHDASVLASRMHSFFDICRHERGNTTKLDTAMDRFAGDHGIAEIERLHSVAQQVARLGIVFSDSQIKKSVSGSIPNNLRWYPPPQYRNYIYYEPKIRIERNDNPGKRKGWGTIDQWRDPQSHQISPKLIFTSSSNPQYGYKAFVVDDEWYAKMGGGKSQQYNYTGLSLPPHQLTITGAENNLAEVGCEIRDILLKAGRTSVDILHYIAGIYNSDLAERYLKTEVVGDLLIRIPRSDSGIGLVLNIVDCSRSLRGLHRLMYDGPKTGLVERESVEDLAGPEVVRQLELPWKQVRGGRFKGGEEAELPVDWMDRLQRTINDSQQVLDSLVNDLYH